MKKVLFLFAGLWLMASCQRQSFDEAVAAEVERFNTQEAPKRMEDVMTQDSMSYDIASRTLTYFYTVEGVGEELFPADQLKEQILQNIRASITLKTHKEHDVTFRYHYTGRASQKVLLDAVFTPEDYK